MSVHHPPSEMQPVNPIRRGLADGWMDDEQRDVRRGDIIVAFGIYGIGFASSSSSYRPCVRRSISHSAHAQSSISRPLSLRHR